MKKCLLLIFLLSSLLSFSQTLNTDQSSTYAVVVGISDYQDEGIPDLRFADKDAEAFANFLRSPAGGSLDEDHLRLLTNEQATMGKIDAALWWLVDECKPGDKVIIYFSGHGDVERRSITQPGFLLCWDVPANAYTGGGAYSLFFLKDIVSTLSIQNKVKVTVITDACRSGKLAGSAIGGTQATAANLATQYANEIKILSCQPDEYSIEGEQWGGGRGAFSYHLLNGLYGMADGNEDLSVNLMEIGRYLEDHVSIEVAPQSQIPMTIGSRGEKLTTVFPEILDQLKAGKEGQLVQFNSTDSRGIEEDVLAEVDSNIVELYFAFQKSLEDKQFLSPENASAPEADKCADVYYMQLIQESKLKKLHNSMRRNYAAALQDDAQQVLNKILNNDVEEASLTKIKQSEKYHLYPGYLQRAAELLSVEHYMYPILQARKLFFEGYLMHVENKVPNKELGQSALAKYRGALELQPDFPHPYYSMSWVYFWQMNQPDSAEYYAHMAVSMAPSWFFPYTAMAKHYFDSQRSLPKAKYFLELAEKTDSVASRSNVWHLYQWAGYYNYIGQFEETERLTLKALEIDSNFVTAHRGLGILYTNTNQFEKAETSLKKVISHDPTDISAIMSLGTLYQKQRRYEEAEFQLLKALQLDSTDAYMYVRIGEFYLKFGKYEEAEQYYLKAFSHIDPTDCLPCLDAARAMMYVKIGQAGKGEQILLDLLRTDSLNITLNTYLGFLYFKTDQIEKAKEIFTKMSNRDTSNLDTKLTLAFLELYEKRYAEAEKKLNDIRSRNATHQGVNSNLGLLYAKTGRYDKADEHFKLELEFHPGNIYAVHRVYFNYAVSYSLQENIEKAFEYVEKALESEYDEWYHIHFKDEPAFDILRAQPERWNALMKKYYPEQSENK